MKKGAKIALGVVGVLVVAGAAVAAWQWDNIQAARYGLTMDKDTLSQRIEENRKALDDAMNQYEVPSYEFSREEISQLTDGSLSTEDAAKKLLESTTQPDTVPAEPQNTAETEQQAAEAEIREKIAQMYVLQATYEGQLQAVVQEAIDEYSAGEHTAERRAQVVYDRMDYLMALEAECDQKVAAVVSRLRELLKATGQDDTLAKQVEETYKEEKSLKKAAYIEEFRNG